MRPVRLLALGMALTLSACSQIRELPTPSLGPQFGGPGSDAAVDVAASLAHSAVFVSGRSAPASNPNAFTFFVRRYNRDGSLSWERRSPPFSTEDYAGGEVSTDAAGNAYTAYSSLSGFGTEASGAPANFLSKLSPTGQLLWRRDLEKDGSAAPGRLGSMTDALATDPAGNTYVSLADVTLADYLGGSLRKYGPGGTLLWERVVGEAVAGRIVDLAVAPDGSLYAVMFGVLTKYSPEGTPVWQVDTGDVGNLSDVAAGGDAVYVINVDNAVVKFNPSGERQWRRDLSFDLSPDLSADAAGNLYVSSSRQVGATFNSDLVVLKLTPTGEVSWTYQPTLPRTRELALGVVARGKSEIYAVGFTDGRVNGINHGGYDAFLLRLDGQGRKVWSR
jgi:hypothetical protein